jgi:hypothetical protein
VFSTPNSYAPERDADEPGSRSPEGIGERGSVSPPSPPGAPLARSAIGAKERFPRRATFHGSSLRGSFANATSAGKVLASGSKRYRERRGVFAGPVRQRPTEGALARSSVFGAIRAGAGPEASPLRPTDRPIAGGRRRPVSAFFPFGRFIRIPWAEGRVPKQPTSDLWLIMTRGIRSLVPCPAVPRSWERSPTSETGRAVREGNRRVSRDPKAWVPGPSCLVLRLAPAAAPGLTLYYFAS